MRNFYRFRFRTLNKEPEFTLIGILFINDDAVLSVLKIKEPELISRGSA